MHRIAHIILILALNHSPALFDAWTTNRNLARERSLPPVGTDYIGTNGLRYRSPGFTGEGNPLLGRNPSPARVYFQVNGDELISDWWWLKHKKGWREVAGGIAGEHITLGVRNLVVGENIKEPKK